jgi:hypothetical protein
VTDVDTENARLRRELAEVRRERDGLKKGGRVFRERVGARYAFMKTHRKDFPLKRMCRVFEVSKSGYYAWLKRKPSKRSQETARLEVAIRAAPTRSRET